MLTVIYPSGTSGKLLVAKVALADVVPVRFKLLDVTFAVTDPLEIVTFARVRLPTEVIVPPSETDVFPIVTALFVR